MHAPPQKVVNRAETLAPQRPSAAGGPTLRSPYTSRFVDTIVAREARVVSVGGKDLFRTSEGKLVELPSEITIDEAIRLEREALAAQKQLGKGPPPGPVPDVKKLAPKELKKEPPKLKARGKAPDRGRGKAAAPAGAAVAGMLKAVGKSKVAQFLAMRGTPALVRGVTGLQRLRQNEQTHDNAGEKLKQTEGAVVNPPAEGQSKSNAGQVETVGERPAPVVDEKAGRRKLQESLEANTPRSIEDVDNFKRDMKAQHVGADVLLVVQGDKGAVTSTFGDVQHTPPPAPPEHTPEPLPPEEVAPPTSTLNLGQGAIAPLQPEHTDVSNYTKEADGKLKEEGVTQEQLDMVDSGDLAAANREKKGMEKSAKTEPQAVQAFARHEATTVDRELQQDERRDRDTVRARRKARLGATAQKQKGTKTALEKKRDEVARKINDIYKRAQDGVKKKLDDLETQSMKRFDEGNARASKDFEDNVNRELDAYKDDRYSGWFGWARRAKDWLLGMDELPGVKAIFERNRAAFVNTIGKLVDDITADNKRVVRECKDELAWARKEIQEYVDKLGPELKGIGKEAAGEMNARLNDLDQFVADKEQQLQNKLKDKQTAAIKAIDEKIEKMKEAMAGALSKLGKLLLLAAKKFFTWALEKFGYSLEEIEGIINKGVAVLKAIFTQPIQFVKNLIRAASTGFLNFGKNFLTHLKNAIFDWLTGSLEGVELPDTWDLRGIASVALQMIGLTWTNIRGKLVKATNETTVKALETGFELVVTLVRDGPLAAWEKLKEMANDIKEAFVEGVKDFIKVKIVQKAIETILSLLIPGAGIVRAIVGIYDTVVFFIQKAKQIAQMVGNFLSSIGEIAAGNIGAAADALEKGLATALKLVINFLARFLRLDGITAKIRAAIEKLRDKVDKMLDRVVEWIVTQAKRLGRFVAGAARGAAARVAGWLGVRQSFRARDGKTHTVFFAGTEDAPRIMMATVEDSVENHIADKRNAGATPAEEGELKKAEGTLAEIYSAGRKGRGARAETETVQTAVQALLNRLTKELQAGGVALTVQVGGTAVPVPLSHVTYATAGPRKALRVSANPLSARAGNTVGSGTGGSDPPGWALKEDGTLTNGNLYVRMHLLHHERHGPGVAWNLVPAPQTFNTGPMKKNVEKPILDATAAGVVFNYTAEVDYPTSTGPEKDFPTSVTVTWSVISNPDPINVKVPAAPGTMDIRPLPTFGGTGVVILPDLNGSSRRDLEEKAGIPQDLANAIVRARGKKSFASPADFKTRVDATLQSMFSRSYKDYAADLIRLRTSFTFDGRQLTAAELT
jgi:hypothetical protein